ncbi:hypothetical protein SeMB42_g07238 [Synchytrium endobioticum]|uniref:Uncharacterized protein n=1 Tax=Synchytrium endobioticum TaxID=286115 RepID=A0A507C638_9FUNG|nr:hypothetical protein SeMB42_g07238 [Synchytrium endobioticum]
MRVQPREREPCEGQLSVLCTSPSIFTRVEVTATIYTIGVHTSRDISRPPVRIPGGTELTLPHLAPSFSGVVTVVMTHMAKTDSEISASCRDGCDDDWLLGTCFGRDSDAGSAARPSTLLTRCTRACTHFFVIVIRCCRRCRSCRGTRHGVRGDRVRLGRGSLGVRNGGGVRVVHGLTAIGRECGDSWLGRADNSDTNRVGRQPNFSLRSITALHVFHHYVHNILPRHLIPVPRREVFVNSYNSETKRGYSVDKVLEKRRMPIPRIDPYSDLPCCKSYRHVLSTWFHGLRDSLWRLGIGTGRIRDLKCCKGLSCK